MEELMNDSTYQCGSCEEVIKAFTSSGETNFCPVCGSRELQGYDEEVDI
jgi:rRNA maturation endonuclease Nob1